MKFLNRSVATQEIRRLMRSSETAQIAVAFWGKGAMKELGLADRRGKPTDVIYLRNADNDWVAIPDAYSDEIGNSTPEFTTVSGKSVFLTDTGSSKYTAVVAE